MTQDFSESMSNRTDEELIKIVTVDRNDYQTEAVEAADKELKTRNIDTTKIESVKQDIEEKQTKVKEFESSIIKGPCLYQKYTLLFTKLINKRYSSSSLYSNCSTATLSTVMFFVEYGLPAFFKTISFVIPSFIPFVVVLLIKYIFK